MTSSKLVDPLRRASTSKLPGSFPDPALRADREHLLLLHDEPLVKVARLAERCGGEGREGRRVRQRCLHRRAPVPDRNPRLGLAVPGECPRASGLLLRLHLHRGPRSRAVPAAVGVLDRGERLVIIEIADDEDDAVVRRVEPLEELPRVLVLVRHVLDVVLGADRRVAVGVLLELEPAERLVNRGVGVRESLVPLSEDGARLVLVLVGGVVKVLEPVRVDLDELPERIGRDGRVVEGHVVGRECIVVRTERLEATEIVLGRDRVRPTEHQMLEEVRVSALAGLDLIPRSGLDERVVGDDPRRVERQRHDGRVRSRASPLAASARAGSRSREARPPPWR